tara:strand:- start:546 stop:1139 length:594 start_codon:yes stop_codon:yes gene_type:complete
MFDKITVSNNKIKNNILSAFHTTGSNILNILYFITYNESLINLSATFSMSYFIWDTYRIYLIQRDESIYILHHIIAINVFDKINNGLYTDLLLFVTLIAELSNIPYYIVYHITKTNKLYSKLTNNTVNNYFSKKIVKYSKLSQIIVFFILRIIVFTLCIPKINIIDDTMLKFQLYTIYILGLYWINQQIKGTYKHFI